MTLKRNQNRQRTSSKSYNMAYPVEIRLDVAGYVPAFDVVERNNLAIGGLVHGMANVKCGNLSTGSFPS